MSIRNILSNPAMKTGKTIEQSEEFNNFLKRIGEVSGIVKDLASDNKDTANAAKVLADQYLEGKVIIEENIQTKVKESRTVINQKAFNSLNKKNNSDTGEMDKDAWMAEVERDAENRAQDKKIRREKADTLKNQAIKAFRREEYEKALTCYNRAIDLIKDNPMLYCDRALTNIKLRDYQKVIKDCEWAVRLNENSFKARLYAAKAYKELQVDDKYAEARKELDEKFPQHEDLIKYFLEKKDQFDDGDYDRSLD